MTHPSLLVLLFTCVAACADDTLHVRACNATDADFDEIETPFYRGSLAVDACSPYVVPDGLNYKTTYVKLTVGSQTLEYQPIDFVGIPQLTSGYWTYRIDSLDLAALSFSVRATEDQDPGG